MPRLIHLNGPSRVGKSTLARRYAQDHPGTLVLDLDVLVGLVGGWEVDFSGALKVARTLGREMAAHHLHGGHDVIFPQLVTVHDHEPDPALEALARAVDATYLEIALVVDEREHLRRLLDKQPTSKVEAQIQTVLEDADSGLANRIRAHLAEYLASRPGAIRIDTTGLDEGMSYRRLLDALEIPAS